MIVNARQDRLLALLQEIDEEQREGVSREGPFGLSVDPAELRPQPQRGRQSPHPRVQLEIVPKSNEGERFRDLRAIFNGQIKAITPFRIQFL